MFKQDKETIAPGKQAYSFLQANYCQVLSSDDYKIEKNAVETAELYMEAESLSW